MDGERIEVTIRNLGTAAAPGHRENGTLRRATEAARAVVTVPSAWRSRVDTERSGGKVLLDDGGDLILAVGTDRDWDVEPLRRLRYARGEGDSRARPRKKRVRAGEDRTGESYRTGYASGTCGGMTGTCAKGDGDGAGTTCLRTWIL